MPLLSLLAGLLLATPETAQPNPEAVVMAQVTTASALALAQGECQLGR